MLLFFQSPLRAKQCRACVCEQEHVPPSDLESSWQHHQTFMRETGRLWRTVQAQGYREREREREAETECVSSKRLLGLICINRELLLFYRTLFCVCVRVGRGELQNGVSATRHASVLSGLQQQQHLGSVWLRNIGQLHSATQQLAAPPPPSILSWEIVGRRENRNPKSEMNICDSAHRVGCITLRL